MRKSPSSSHKKPTTCKRIVSCGPQFLRSCLAIVSEQKNRWPRRLAGFRRYSSTCDGRMRRVEACMVGAAGGLGLSRRATGGSGSVFATGAIVLGTVVVGGAGGNGFFQPSSFLLEHDNCSARFPKSCLFFFPVASTGVRWDAVSC